jgi:hypothetical protein
MGGDGDASCWALRVTAMKVRGGRTREAADRCKRRVTEKQRGGVNAEPVRSDARARLNKSRLE